MGGGDYWLAFGIYCYSGCMYLSKLFLVLSYSHIKMSLGMLCQLGVTQVHQMQNCQRLSIPPSLQTCSSLVSPTQAIKPSLMKARTSAVPPCSSAPTSN